MDCGVGYLQSKLVADQLVRPTRIGDLGVFRRASQSGAAKAV